MRTTPFSGLGRVSTCLLALTLLGCPDEGPGNRAPVIVSTPSASAVTYQPYAYVVQCADPDGDLVTLERGPEDSCSGTVTDHGNRTATYAFTPGTELSGSLCRLSIACVDPSGAEEVQSVDVDIQPAPDVSALGFGTLAPWDTPLADYHADATVALGSYNFMHGIHDLAVWEDRLYLGYGDANVNIGREVPIRVRAYTAPEPGGTADEFITDEEQISHYRMAGNRLVIPGVDATEDALLGNVYTLDATGWTKRRTLEWAWHVHDVASVGGVLYAVGSGGSMDDYNQSTVRAFLWGATGEEPFAVVADLAHPQPPGDHRLTNLLVVDGTLYAFGYYSAAGTTYGERYRLEGGSLVPWSELSDFFVLSTQPLGESAGLAIGVTIGTSLTWGARRITSAAVAPVGALSGKTVLDAAPLPDDRALLLTLEGDTYPTPSDGPFDISISILEADGSLFGLLDQTLETAPVSVAFWQRSLYVGLEDGALWSSAGTP